MVTLRSPTGGPISPWTSTVLEPQGGHQLHRDVLTQRRGGRRDLQEPGDAHPWPRTGRNVGAHAEAALGRDAKGLEEGVWVRERLLPDEDDPEGGLVPRVQATRAVARLPPFRRDDERRRCVVGDALDEAVRAGTLEEDLVGAGVPGRAGGARLPSGLVAPKGSERVTQRPVERRRRERREVLPLLSLEGDVQGADTGERFEGVVVDWRGGGFVRRGASGSRARASGTWRPTTLARPARSEAGARKGSSPCG